MNYETCDVVPIIQNTSIHAKDDLKKKINFVMLFSFY